MLTNQPLDGVEAHSWGLVSRLTGPGEARAVALEIGHRLADGPDRALSHTVRLIRDAPDRTFSEQLRHEAASIVDALRTPNGREGVAAFLAKRRPDFVATRQGPGKGATP